MVIFNGFWAGFLSGVVSTLVFMFVYSMILNILEYKSGQRVMKFIEKLDNAAKEVAKKGDSDIESNN